MKGVLKKVTKFNLTMMIMGAVLTCLMLFSNMTISHAKSDETDDKKWNIRVYILRRITQIH